MDKKVILIGPAYPYRGGIAAFNENLATIFQKNGWDCKIYTFTQQYPNLLFPGKNQLTTEDPKPNLTIQRGIYSMNPLNWLKMSKEIVAEKPDLVITQYWMPFMAPAFGTILRGIKKGLPETTTTTVVHNFKPHESRIGDQQLNKYIINRTDLLVSLSDSVKAEIEETTEDKPIINLFHPIYDHYGDALSKSLAKQKMGWQDDTAFLLFFGLIRSYKGLDLLIEALPLLKTNKKFKLYIAGEFYEDEKKYKKLISDLQLEDTIIIRNEYIPNDEIPSLFCGAEAVVLPYRTATQSGVVPIALHFEKPIIVTRVGGLTELLEEHNLALVSEVEPQAIANKIDSFLEKPSILNSDFRSIKKELSWQNFYDTFIKELKSHES